MKQMHLMMSILIQGLRQPRNDIDVFLQLLMEDLLQLWMIGERVWDEYKKEHFKLKALLFITITDLPGLGSLSRQVTKGYKGCVVCLDGTSTKFLKHSKKMVYMGHHRFLPSTHPYRKKNPSMGQ